MDVVLMTLIHKIIIIYLCYLDLQ